MVAGSGPLLRGALANVLDNAIRYAGARGRVRVTIGVDLHEIRLVVEDSGAGIPEAARERVLEPFVRGVGVDADLSGFGLGLAVTQRIIAAHGGSIVVASSPDLGGAAFTLQLPRA